MYLTSMLINILSAWYNKALTYINANVIIMDSESEDKNLRIVIKLSIAEKQYKKTIELADNYVAKFGRNKEVCMLRAMACSELGRPQECIEDLDHAVKLGSSLKQVTPLKLNLPQQAEKQLSKLLKQDSQLDRILKLSKAIEYSKDPFQVYKLTPKEQQVMSSMDNWLLRAGASYSKLKTINLSAGYRGVIAVKHISKGEPIVYIPKSELITLQMARSTKICQTLISKQYKLQSPKHTYLSLLLLQLKSTSAASLLKFKPYLDILPIDHSSFPINYSKQQLSLLQGSPFLNMIYQKVIDLKKDYDTVIKCIDSTGASISCGKFGFGDFCWARTIVGSRIFGILVSGVKTQILVPFADMLNHRQPKQTAWNYEQTRNGFVIQSLEDIEVGQQVFDSYGRKCNSRFLLNYGFVLKDNPDNQISLRLVIENDHPLASTKKTMMHENANQVYAIVKKVSMNLNTNKFYQLMGCLRFICIEDNQTLSMLKKISNIQVTGEPYSIIRTPPISIKNEIQIWQKLDKICEDQLSKYSNTLQDDLQLLQNRQLNQNERNIVTLRAGQKKLLTQFAGMAKDVIKLLKEENIIEALQSKVTAKYARYLYKILMLIPSMNKKKMEKKLSSYFTTASEENVEQTEQVPQS